jgi:hypothetical protein
MRKNLLLFFLIVFQLKIIISKGELNFGLRLVYEIEYE